MLAAQPQFSPSQPQFLHKTAQVPPHQTIPGPLTATAPEAEMSRWKAKGVPRAGLLQVGLWPPPLLSTFPAGLISQPGKGGRVRGGGGARGVGRALPPPCLHPRQITECTPRPCVMSPPCRR